MRASRTTSATTAPTPAAWVWMSNTRVKHYPFIDIKLDMEVVWDYFKTRDSLLPHVVTAFKELGFTVTAEGIETQEMADALAGIGCNHLQGYLFDRPLPIDEFVKKYGR